MSLPTLTIQDLVKNVDSRDQLGLHGSNSMGGALGPAFSGATGWFWCSQPSPVLDPLPRAPYSDQLKSFHSKGALVWNLALIQLSLLLCTFFFSMTTWSLSANQDKITDNKGLENNQAVGTEATIPHLCKDERCPCTHWTAAGHPNGECQDMVIKGWGSGRRKEPCSEIALNSVTTLRWQRKHSSWQASQAWSYNGLALLKQRHSGQQRQTLLMTAAADAN